MDGWNEVEGCNIILSREILALLGIVWFGRKRKEEKGKEEKKKRKTIFLLFG